MDNFDKAQKYTYLKQLTTPELENILRADMALPGEDDVDMVLYIMEVIAQREGGNSPKNNADMQQAKEEFYKIYNTDESAGQPLYDSAYRPGDTNIDRSSIIENPEKATFGQGKRHRSFRSIGRMGLVAALTVALMLVMMVVAQAAGFDVFGAMARWTDEVFSLGTIRHESGIDTDTRTQRNPTEVPPDKEQPFRIEYTSLQDGLDAYEITEVAAPTWLPDRFVFDNAYALSTPYGTLWMLSAGYWDGTAALNIGIEYFDTEPTTQIEKTSAPIETFECNGIEVYLLENTNSNAAAWATEHYAYYIDGQIEKDELRQVAISAIKNAE